MPHVLTRQIVGNYDPFEQGFARNAFTAYWNSSVPLAEREVFLYATGGGWVQGTGTALTFVDSTLNPDIYSLIQAGHVVVTFDYTKSDPTITGQGAFDLGTYRQRSAGPDTWYELDSSPSKLAIRSAESDFIHLVQYLQANPIQGSNMVTDPSRWTAILQSASWLSAAWTILGPNRADSTVSPSSRYAAPTRIGAVACYRCIAAPSKYLTAAGIVHYTNGAGALAPTIGDALAGPQGSELMNEASPAWTATRTAEARTANATLRCWMQGALQQTALQDGYSLPETGPFDLASIPNNSLASVHPLESPHIMQAELRGLAGSEHDDCSVFAVNRRRLGTNNLKVASAYTPDSESERLAMVDWVWSTVHPTAEEQAAAVASGKACPSPDDPRSAPIGFGGSAA